MSLSTSTQYGASYKWGFKSTDAPTIDAQFSPRTGDLKYEPEVNNNATDGEGHSESRVEGKPAFRKITATITGYISTTFDPSAVANNFSWTPPGTSVSRFFLISSIGEPIKKGEYTEVSIEAMSEIGITSVASTQP